ncbi:MAG: hypothetical protein MK101_09435 [Phycisphaerales bacterium]|nr:hypothetical protein [Phycisphaerales bacterium]
MNAPVTVSITCLGPLKQTVCDTPLTITCRPLVRSLIDELAGRYATIEQLRGRIAVAHASGYLQMDDLLHEGMALLLVPPVSGG